MERIFERPTVKMFYKGQPIEVALEDKEAWIKKGCVLSLNLPSSQPVPPAKVQTAEINVPITRINGVKQDVEPVKAVVKAPLPEKADDIHNLVFDKMTKEQLLTYATQQKIKGVRSDMKRESILGKIKKEKGIKVNG